eukprot:6470874-Amphidinium_carterae.1
METLQSKSSNVAPPPAIANPWSACAAKGYGAGFLPSGATGSQSILAPSGACSGYHQALAEAQRLLGTAQPSPPPGAPPRQIPTGLPGEIGGGSGKAPDRERKVDADLRAFILKGGEDSQLAINLAIIDALGRVGSSGGGPRASTDLDPLDQFFEQDHGADHDSSFKGSNSFRCAKHGPARSCHSARSGSTDSAMQSSGRSCVRRRHPRYSLDHGGVWGSAIAFPRKRSARAYVGAFGSPSWSHDARRDIVGTGSNLSVFKSHRACYPVRRAAASCLEPDVVAADPQPRCQCGGPWARSPLG